MKSTQPTLFLVWEFKTVLDFTAYNPDMSINPDMCITHQEAQLRAVDTDITMAREHRDFLNKQQAKRMIHNLIDSKPTDLTTFYRIESLSANHLFATDLLGTLKRINKRKKL